MKSLFIIALFFTSNSFAKLPKSLNCKSTAPKYYEIKLNKTDKGIDLLTDTGGRQVRFCQTEIRGKSLEIECDKTLDDPVKIIITNKVATIHSKKVASLNGRVVENCEYEL